MGSNNRNRDLQVAVAAVAVDQNFLIFWGRSLRGWGWKRCRVRALKIYDVYKHHKSSMDTNLIVWVQGERH